MKAHLAQSFAVVGILGAAVLACGESAAVLAVLTVSFTPRAGLAYWSNGFAAIAIIALTLFDGTRSSKSPPGLPL